MKQIVLFGDSITQFGYDVAQRGWVAQLASRVQAKRDVVSRGCSGYTTATYRAVLPAFLAASWPTPAAAASVDAVVVFLGANDAVLPGGVQHVPRDEYRAGLRAILDAVAAHFPHARAKIAVAPPCIDEAAWAAVYLGRTPADSSEYPRLNAVLREYAETAMDVAGDAGWVGVDFFGALSEIKDAPGTFTDGLHLAAPGNDLLYSLVWDALVAKCPDYADEMGARGFPYWATFPPTADKDGIRAIVEGYEF
ncbi:isoamyl acetate-hydrolyzing esterase [Blastocladiella emersonii ATCC 22665]|nr:isoamyl acetate-hydrolyzing esterase [Blastocladiella emersonii ATCC 22665]